MTSLMNYLIVFTILISVIAISISVYYTVKEDDNSSIPGPKSSISNWIAVGNNDTRNGNILYSADGKEWKRSTGEIFSTMGNGVAYGTSDGTSPLWVAVGDDEGVTYRGNIIYSADGKVWQESTGESFSVEGNGIAYGTSDGTSPLWVAVGYDQPPEPSRGNILYSADGKMWQKSTGVSFSILGNGVAYGTSNGTSPLWVAVGSNMENNGRDNIMYSDNGKEWQQSTGMSFSEQGFGVAYGTSDGISPLWVAVGDSNDLNIMYSDDGKEWKKSTGVSFIGLGYEVAYGTSDGTSPLWVAVGTVNYTNGPGRILYSTDGKEWQESTGASFAYSGFGVDYGTDEKGMPLWLVVGDEDGSVGPGKTLFSTNGKEWQEPKDPNIFSISGNGIASRNISGVINSKN